MWYAKVAKENQRYRITDKIWRWCDLKSTGIVRKVDELGRIVLPVELRRTLGISEKDRLEISVEGSSIVLRKHSPTCVFCDAVRDVVHFRGKSICPRCLEELQAAQAALGSEQ